MGAVFSAFDDLLCERRPAYAVTYGEEKADISTDEGYREYVVDQLQRVCDHAPDPMTGRRVPDTTIGNINMREMSADIYSGQLDIV